MNKFIAHGIGQDVVGVDGCTKCYLAILESVLAWSEVSVANVEWCVFLEHRRRPLLHSYVCWFPPKHLLDGTHQCHSLIKLGRRKPCQHYGLSHVRSSVVLTGWYEQWRVDHYSKWLTLWMASVLEANRDCIWFLEYGERPPQLPGLPLPWYQTSSFDFLPWPSACRGSWYYHPWNMLLVIELNDWMHIPLESYAIAAADSWYCIYLSMLQGVFLSNTHYELCPNDKNLLTGILKVIELVHVRDFASVKFSLKVFRRSHTLSSSKRGHLTIVPVLGFILIYWGWWIIWIQLSGRSWIHQIEKQSWNIFCPQFASHSTSIGNCRCPVFFHSLYKRVGHNEIMRSTET